MGREDAQRQDRKRRNDIGDALVRQREDRLLFFHAVVVAFTTGDDDALVVRGAVIENSHRGRSRERPIGWSRPRSPPNGRYYAGIKRCVRAAIGILFSRVVSTRKISRAFRPRIESRRFTVPIFVRLPIRS